jgi:hypothetical protein
VDHVTPTIPPDPDPAAMAAARHLGAELGLVTTSLLAVEPARTAVVVERLIARALVVARAAGLAEPHEAGVADADVPPAARRCVLAGLMVSLALGRPHTTRISSTSGGEPILLDA